MNKFEEADKLKIEFRGLQELTLIDYPGKIACTLYVFGCNYRCPYCHNPELINRELAEKETQLYKPSELLQFLHDRKSFLEGICITGGEPTLHQDLPVFIAMVKQMGYKVKLDTNASNPSMLKELIEKKLIDYIAIDYKAPLEKWQEVVKVKVDMEKVKESLKLAVESAKYGIEHEFRVTVVPKLLDPEDIIEIAKEIKQLGSNKLYLQQFNPLNTLDPEYSKIKPYPVETLKNLVAEIKKLGLECEIRNETY